MAKKFRENVEIISSASGQSGLRLTNLPSGTAQTVFNGILGIDAAGDVIKIDATKIATVTVGPVAPSSPVVGQQWLDTSVSPSELMIYNGTSWEVSNDEVQHYANFAAFPATGDEDVVYIDDATDTAYLWDSTTSAYVSAVGGASGLFSISDGTNTQAVGVSDTIVFQENASIADVLQFEVAATDIVELQLNTTGLTIGQVPTYNGTKLVWATPASDVNIYTDDGTIPENRNVSIEYGYGLYFSNPVDPFNTTISIEAGSGDHEVLIANNPSSGYRTVLGGNQSQIIMESPTQSMEIVPEGLYNSDKLQINSSVGEYHIGGVSTAPTVNNSLNSVLVRDGVDGRIYLRDVSTIVPSRYTTTITPVVNVQQVVTHNLNNSDVIVQVRDAATNEVVSVEIQILTANTVGITSTTTDDLRIVVL